MPAADVALDAPIVIDFSTLMDTASVERGDPPRAVDGGVAALEPRAADVVPVAPWEADRRYTLTIGVGARDQAGTPLEEPFRLSFRTVAAGLGVETIVPADGVAGISVTTPIALRLRPGARPRERRTTTCSPSPRPWPARSMSSLRPGRRACDDATPRILRFQPSGPLEPNTTYEVTLGPGLLRRRWRGHAGGRVLDLHHRCSRRRPSPTRSSSSRTAPGSPTCGP